jgi:hypothetical protein
MWLLPVLLSVLQSLFQAELRDKHSCRCSHGQHGPPHCGWDAGKVKGLGVVLQEVDYGRGENREEDYGREAHGQLSLLSFDDVYDNSQGFGVPAELEEPEGPKDPQASQEPMIRKDVDQIGWQNYHKVD